MARDDVYLKQIELGPLANFVYLIGDPETRKALVVDPGWDPPVILEQAARDGYTIGAILLTHTHPDHINGVPDVLEACKAKVYVHRKEGNALRLPKDVLAPVEGGDKIQVGGLEITCMHTPGHSPGSQAFLVRGSVLTGDTLFVGSIGRVDLPGSDPDAMWDSLQRLKGLDDPTAVHPGHNYGPTPTSTIGMEKRTNPYLRIDSADRFLQHVG